MRLHTKQDFRDWMFQVLNPLKPLYSEGCARLHLGDTGVTYPQVSIEMEAFSRPLWALVPYWLGGGAERKDGKTGAAGNGRAERKAGEAGAADQSAGVEYAAGKGRVAGTKNAGENTADITFEELYRKGLANGTNPDHPEYWGGFNDYDQRFVEMAAIASGIIFAPEKVWEPLHETEKANLAAWLYGINEYVIPDCNWQFFMILVNVALREQGCKYSAEKLESGLDNIESYYLGDGWYRDGASSQKDYYISFAMHYYGLLYAMAMEDSREEEERERCCRFKERAEMFAGDFLYWFDENGAALPFGRSLSYRFGEAAFWSAYVFAGLDGVPVAVVKGILARHLNWWMEQKMFDRDGVLTIGYAYPNLVMAERYNAPGSPYWGMKTMLCLGLPDDHPFWSVEAVPMPKLDTVKPLYQADMLMHRHDGDVVAYAAGVCEKYGHGHVPEKYSKFAYSTRFGFSVAKSQIVLHENAPDSALAFVIDGDDYVFVRKVSLDSEVQQDRVISTWQPFHGIRVSSTVIPTEHGHKRIHKIESDYNCTAYDCGFAVEKFTDGYEEHAAENTATVKYAKQGCTVTGRGPEAAGLVIGADPNTNVLYPNASIPAVSYRIEKDAAVRIETEIETFYE